MVKAALKPILERIKGISPDIVMDQSVCRRRERSSGTRSGRGVTAATLLVLFVVPILYLSLRKDRSQETF